MNRLGGEWSFISIGSLKAAQAPAIDIRQRGYSHIVNVGAFSYAKSERLTYLDIPVVDRCTEALGPCPPVHRAFLSCTLWTGAERMPAAVKRPICTNTLR